MGVVHILVADERVVCIDPVEAHELTLEVVHEEVLENNHLRQPYKTLLLVLENFKDKVIEPRTWTRTWSRLSMIFQKSWVWANHIRINILEDNGFKQCGTPPNAHNTPPNPRDWSVLSGFKQWETPPNAQ
uniref:Uncharacterized protein n=1 Tax=Brassica campestris TaxID=3711 RepID=A0A3P6DJJ6_BRACM|nr:unnamed protein product [Brassica rapa]